jgi:hypothetical protein
VEQLEKRREVAQGAGSKRKLAVFLVHAHLAHNVLGVLVLPERAEA